MRKIKPRSQSEISRAHNTKVFPGKRKAKNPITIYYVYHESWNNLVQNSNPRALSTIQSSHTIIHKLANTCANFHVQTTYLLCTIPAIRILTIEFELPSFHMLIIISIAYVIAWLHFTQITTDSQTVPFTCYLNWVSTGSDMHVVNHGESSVACEFIDCELISWTLTSASLVTTSTTELNSLNYTYNSVTTPNHSVINEIID